MRRQQTRHAVGNRTRQGVVALLLVALACWLAPGTSALAQDQAETFAYEDIELRVALWLDREEGEVYRKGDDLAVGFQTNEDAYAVVYRVDTEGVVTVLWPRSALDDGFVFGGHEYQLPVTGSRRLRVNTAEGEGFVEVLVSRYPFDLRQLELDFHHDHRAQRYDFRVAGDPFLAMNEVNFAITGLEDPGDYVVSNYLSYYVHREVEHPRYLCNQCHFEDDTAYHPYRDSCQLDITVDYRWSNGWWDRYGYYPVYVNPVYVYVDPWSHRPWVNFWYDPWWRSPSVNICVWDGPVGVWVHNPRYQGNHNMRYRDGHRNMSPPLSLVIHDGPVTKRREYGSVTSMVRDEPRAGGRNGGTARRGPRTGPETPYRGEAPAHRVQPRFDREETRGGTPGLRIQRGGGGGTRSSDSGRAAVRHTAGGKTTPPRTAPADRVAGGRKTTRAGGTPGIKHSRPVPDLAERRGGSRSGDAVRPDTPRGGGTIRPVEPRQKGTRIWNSDRSRSAGSRNQRPRTVRPADPKGSRDATPTRRNGGAVRNGKVPRKSPGTNTRTGVRKSNQGSSHKQSRDATGGGQRTGKQPTRRDGGGAKSGSRDGGSRSSAGGGRGRKATNRTS